MFCPTINLDKLWELVSEQTRANYGKKPDGPDAVVEVTRAVSEKSCFVAADWHRDSSGIPSMRLWGVLT